MNKTEPIDQLKVRNICLATVTSRSYWKGTRTMLASFLRYNPWFEGDIVLITDQKEEIQRSAGQEKIHAIVIGPGKDLKRRIAQISDLDGINSSHLRRLYVFEIFRLWQYDRVIYYDSDMVHINTTDASDFFSGDFVAVRDPWYFRGFCRNRNTLEKVPIVHNAQEVYQNFFNSGFLSVGKRFLSNDSYNELINKIEIIMYKNLSDRLLDEPILNAVFEGKVSLISVSYNCPIHLITEGIIQDQVSVLHFTGKNKPWKVSAWIKLIWKKKSYLKLLMNWRKTF